MDMDTPTIIDIARRCGLSAKTVWRHIHRDGTRRPATMRKIARATEAINSRRKPYIFTLSKPNTP
jgi:DNA-binding LacI/PurR family transcriptional regulator